MTQKCWSITGGKTISSGDQLSACASSSRHPAAHRCPVRGVIAILPRGLWKKALALFADPHSLFCCLFLALPFGREGEGRECVTPALPPTRAAWQGLGCDECRGRDIPSLKWLSPWESEIALMWALASPHIGAWERWAGDCCPAPGERNLFPWLCKSTSLNQLPPLWLWHSQSHCHVFWWMLAYTGVGGGCGDVAGQGGRGTPPQVTVLWGR